MAHPSDLDELGLRGLERPRRRVRPRRRLPKAVGVLVVLLVVAGLLGGAVLGGRALLGSFTAGASSPDYAGEGTGEVLVQVADGDSASDIAAALRAKDVVKSTGAFREVAAADERSRSLQPGFYRLRTQMSAASALALLLDPASRARSRVTLPEGVTLAVALKRIADSTEVPLKDLQKAVASPRALGLPAYADGQVEGFLFPATYDIEPGTTAVQALKMMVERFDEAAQELDLEGRAEALGRTPYEVLITASLVEEETAFPDDRSKVARVVYNRLEDGMPLQFDSTVNYIRDEQKLRLSLNDLRVESEYNTYRNRGLPPTPIASPGEAALEAALAPAKGDYVYFVRVDEEGRSLFTSDYDEFLRAKAKAQREGVY